MKRHLVQDLDASNAVHQSHTQTAWDWKKISWRWGSMYVKGLPLWLNWLRSNNLLRVPSFVSLMGRSYLSHLRSLVFSQQHILSVSRSSSWCSTGNLQQRLQRMIKNLENPGLIGSWSIVGIMRWSFKFGDWTDDHTRSNELRHCSM